MYPTAYYTDSLINSDGRFRTLRRFFALTTTHGEPQMTMSSNTINFDVDILGKLYTMRCLDSGNVPYDMASLQIPLGAPFVEWRFLPSEMTIYNSAMQPKQVDVVVEERPLGIRLDMFVARASNRQMCDAIGSFIELCDALAQNGFVHNNLKGSNIIVDANLTMRVIDYRWAQNSPNNVEADNLAIASTALALYLYATCEVKYNGSLFVRHNLLQALRTKEHLPLSEMVLGAKGDLVDRLHLSGELRRLWQMCRGQYIESCYDHVGPCSDNLRAVLRDGRWHYIDPNGASSFEGSFDYAEEFCSSRAVVGQNDTFALIDTSGRYILPMAYEDVRWYPDNHLVIACYDGQSRIYGASGEPKGERYDWIGDCESGRIAVGINDKYGFVDYDGNVVIDLIYDNAYDFRGGVAIVERDGEDMLIDLMGNALPTTK